MLENMRSKTGDSSILPCFSMKGICRAKIIADRPLRIPANVITHFGGS
ncbi:hypothetical protein [Burkholderia contaminans]|nr:hypothetical protein [Burkholderia contaminans]